MSKFLKATVAAVLIASPVYAEKQGLGREALPEEIAAWDIDVRPDGLGLPEGGGTVAEGEEVFSERCAVCHGDFGEAVDRWPVLAGGQGTLTRDRPVKTIGSYWPYLSTVWDYVHRAMPFGAAQSLEDDEVYAIVAYLMYVNDLVDDEDFELNRENFADQVLPNEANFFMDDRAAEGGELATFSGEVCMENCKDEVKITARAAVVDVTPEETKARKLKEMVEAAKSKTPVEAGVAKAEDAVEEAPATEETAAEQPAEGAALDADLVADGEKVFKKCKACHQVGEGAKNKVGPMLNGVMGRAMGGVEGFKYSKGIIAMGEGGEVWNDETLAEFLSKPRDYIKGTKMSFAGLNKEDDIKAVTEYLKSFSQ